MSRWVWAVVAVLTFATTVRAQDAVLAARLRPDVLAAVQQQIDSANRARLPGSMLAEKALELQARGVAGPDIVSAVRRGRANLVVARSSLGDASTPTELRAGADAAEGGVSGRDLARVREAAARRPLATPLVVLSDLVATRVSVGKAGDLMVQMLRAGVRDPELLQFQKDVKTDIGRGADPEVSAATRAKAAMDRASGGRRGG